MKLRLSTGRHVLLVFLLAAQPVSGQFNADPGIDVELGALDGLSVMGRTGNFPTGVIGASMDTAACNVGTAVVPWEKPMDPDHPFIAFLIARDNGVRMQQISGRSFVKHGIYAFADSLCNTCQGGDPINGSFLGLGCSDTYSRVTNGNRIWLGPPDEIDPWLGGWEPVGSYFDSGDPAAPPPANGDGFRSLTSAQVDQFSGSQSRIEVRDIDLIDSGSDRFFYQAQYVIIQELEAQRANNLGWREFQPNWLGANWDLSNLSPLNLGTVLEAWNGSDLSSNTNGVADGRVYIAVKVTGPIDGFYHYEYAVHNRDNSRGILSFRLPLCADATISGMGFSDPDQVAGNDWTASLTATEVSWHTTANPIAWNSIYNFWFDSDAAPIDAVSATLDQFGTGSGSSALTIGTRVPMGLFNHDLGPGCSLGMVPRILGVGSPPRATLGNTSFAIRGINLARSTVVAYLFTPVDSIVDLGGGCTSYFSNQSLFLRVRTSNAIGESNLNLPIPNDVTLEGVDLNLQLVELDPDGGPYAGDFDLSNGLRVRIGNSIPNCP